jgi:hypothetical protein
VNIVCLRCTAFYGSILALTGDADATTTHQW